MDYNHLKESTDMKTSIIFLTVLILQNFALGGGEGGGGSAGGNGGAGGSGGGQKRAMRAPASIEDDKSINESADTFGSVCLQTLKSSFKINLNDKDYMAKLDNEIILGISSKKKGRDIASVDSVQYPECYAYAKETNNEKIKSLLVKRKPGTTQAPEIDRETLGHAISK